MSARFCTSRVGIGALSLLIISTSFAQAADKPRPPLPPWPEVSLSSWRFDEPYALLNEEVSGKQGNLDRSIWMESWSGYALNRQGQVLKPVALPMATAEHWNVAPQEGTIRFWFNPDWSSSRSSLGDGPGHYARLMELASGEKKEVLIWWSLYIAPDGNSLFFSGPGADGPMDYLQGDIDWQAGEWHMVSVSYGPQESVLMVDGALVAMGEGFPGVPLPLVEQTTLVMGTDVAGHSSAGGQFEELSTFDHMVLPWNWDYYYHGTRQVAAKGPITPEEEGATLLMLTKVAVAQKAQFEGSGLGGPMFLESMEGLYLLPPEIDDTNLVLTLMGAETNKSYNILFGDQLPAQFWSTAAIGSLGQSNFTVSMVDLHGFYQAAEGDDWDSDGVKNWADAQPSDAGVGALTITINVPAHGSTIE